MNSVQPQRGRDRSADQLGIAPVRGELRYWLELARLLGDECFRRVIRAPGRRPVRLIPGFLAGDASLAVLAGWLRRRGHEVRGSGMWVNADCAGRELSNVFHDTEDGLSSGRSARPRLGNFGGLLYNVAPKASDAILNTAYKLFPSPTRARPRGSRRRTASP